MADWEEWKVKNKGRAHHDFNMEADRPAREEHQQSCDPEFKPMKPPQPILTPDGWVRRVVDEQVNNRMEAEASRKAEQERLKAEKIAQKREELKIKFERDRQQDRDLGR